MDNLYLDTIDCMCDDKNALFEIYTYDLGLKNSFFTNINYDKTNEFN